MSSTEFRKGKRSGSPGLEADLDLEVEAKMAEDDGCEASFGDDEEAEEEADGASSAVGPCIVETAVGCGNVTTKTGMTAKC